MQVITENILDMIENSGENELSNDLSAFSSPLNPEIEGFIREKAIDFAKRKLHGLCLSARPVWQKLWR